MSRKKVLIVEDDRSHQLVLQNILEADYEIEAVSSVEVALERILASRFDLFILGLRSNEDEGLQLALSIKGLKKHQDKPILYLTPKEDANGRSLGLDAPIQQVLSKPFSSVCLRNKMRELLSEPTGNQYYVDEKIAA